MANLAHTMEHLRRWLHAGQRVTDTGFMARCPCHDDRTASLSVTLKAESRGDIILIKCFAGCQTSSILDAVGLTFSDLFEDGRAPSKKSQCHYTTPYIPEPPRNQSPPPDYTDLLTYARSRAGHRNRLLALADHLGARPESRTAYADAADAIGVVWLDTHDQDAEKVRALLRAAKHPHANFVGSWLIPERDDQGTVIGLSRRMIDGQKIFLKGGKRGLAYDPRHTIVEGETIYCVEGASDVVAMLACGMCAVGRPNNTGSPTGNAHLVNMVNSSVCGRLMVIGENDQKPGSDKHPGMVGVKAVVKHAEGMINTDLLYAFPPTTVKDARAWIAGRSGTEVGVEFASTLLSSATVVKSMAEVNNVCGQCGDQALECCTVENLTYKKEGKSLNSTDNDSTLSPPETLAHLNIPEPPPVRACPRPAHIVLSHKEDCQRHRVQAVCCSSWQCPVCAIRSAHKWVLHLAGCADPADSGGCADISSRNELRVGSVTETELRSLARRLVDDHGGDYAALQLSPGLYLLIASLPPSAQRFARLNEVTLPSTYAEVSEQLAAWYHDVYSGTRTFVGDGKKCRPVLTSRGWAIHRQPGEWVRIAALDPVANEDAVETVRAEGGQVSKDLSRLYGLFVPPEHMPESIVWLVEWRSDSDTLHRITNRLVLAGQERANAPPRPIPPPREIDWEAWVDPFAARAV